MKEMMERAGNSHLLTILSYPNTGHLIEPPFTPFTRISAFRSAGSSQRSMVTFRLGSFISESFEVQVPKSGLQFWVLTSVSVSCCLCSFNSVGRRDGGTFSRSGRLLEEDARLSEGESVQQQKLQCSLIFPPVTMATTDDHRIAKWEELLQAPLV